MRLEVRCCCDPGRLIGTLDVSAADVRLGQRLVFATTPSPDFLAFPRFSTSGALEAHITCEVAVFERAAGAPRTLALRLTHVDERLLDRVPGFERKHVRGTLFAAESASPTPDFPS